MNKAGRKINNKNTKTTIRKTQKENAQALKHNYKKIEQVRLKISQRIKRDVENENLRKKLIKRRAKEVLGLGRNANCNGNNHSVHKNIEMPLKELTNALNVLNTDEKDSAYNNARCKRNISDLVQFQEATSYAPSSYTALCYEIQRCIMSHDWSNLTECLVLLLDGPYSLRQIIWKVAMLILLHNPHVGHTGILEDFLKMCVCCQTELAMDDFLQKVLVLQDELKTAPKIGLLKKSVNT